MKRIAVSLALSLVAAGAPLPRNPDTARAVKFIVEGQNDNGGWGAEPKAAPDVATTAIAGIALIRLGHTYSAGEHSASVRKAVEYVLRAVEKTPMERVEVEPQEYTQPQRKLGRQIDTFLAAQFLGEASKGMPAGKDRSRAMAALDACVYKIQRAQQKDGSFSAGGWAPILQSAFATTGLYAAKGAGIGVPKDVIAKTDGYMQQNYDAKTRTWKTDASAGVALYSAVATLRSAAESGNMDSEAARAALSRLSDESFMRGYGSYGGEEHVSYMLTTEALARAGGPAFERWSKSIRQRLGDIQRENGTWRGDHCITSSIFCTAASLITLAVKEAPVKAAQG
jgi:hypothetical protein